MFSPLSNLHKMVAKVNLISHQEFQLNLFQIWGTAYIDHGSIFMVPIHNSIFRPPYWFWNKYSIVGYAVYHTEEKPLYLVSFLVLHGISCLDTLDSNTFMKNVSNFFNPHYSQNILHNHIGLLNHICMFEFDIPFSRTGWPSKMHAIHYH